MSRRSRSSVAREGLVVGALRVDASPVRLARRLQAGDVAVIDVLDLDRASAEALAVRGPAAVLNVQSSISGRYPAGGASVLAARGIPLIDEVDGSILTVREGTIATIDLLAQERREQPGHDKPAGLAATDRQHGEAKDGEAKDATDQNASARSAKAKSGKGAKKAAAADEEGSSTGTDKRSADADRESNDSAEDGKGSADAHDTGATPRANPVTRWLQGRSEQRIARKRASLTWLDELREVDAGDETSSAADPPAASDAARAPDASDAIDDVSPAPVDRRPGEPWRATIQAGGLDLGGTVMDALAVDAALAEAESGMATQLAVFTANAMDVVDRSREALLEGEGLPVLGVDVKDKHVVIVAPGYGAAAALRSIKPYLRDHKPVVIGIGDAAEAARKARCQPAVVIGATSAVSDATLTAAKTVITHQPGTEQSDAGEARLGALGRDHVASDLPVASEDLALLLARAGGAKTIVTVGVDATLLDFLESGRVDAAGTFLARLSVGARLVDAQTLASVYRPRWSGVVIIAGLVLAMAALGAALWANADSRAWIQDAMSATGVTG